MRKLSELLPIARQRLISDRPLPRSPSEPSHKGFVCDAAQACWGEGEMTYDEFSALRNAIQEEIVRQDPRQQLRSGLVMLFRLFRHRGMFTPGDEYGNNPERDPAYWPLRDQWLNELQAQFEAEGR